MGPSTPLLYVNVSQSHRRRTKIPAFEPLKPCSIGARGLAEQEMRDLGGFRFGESVSPVTIGRKPESVWQLYNATHVPKLRCCQETYFELLYWGDHITITVTQSSAYTCRKVRRARKVDPIVYNGFPRDPNIQIIPWALKSVNTYCAGLFGSLGFS